MSLTVHQSIAVEACRRRAVSASIYKKELKTVVRELLVCTQSNHHETITALWNPYRRVSSRGRRPQICFSRGARDEKPENDSPAFWFYRESVRTSVHGMHIVIVEAPSLKCHGGMSFFTGSSPKAGCLCFYIYKEELKTVVRKLRASTRPNGHETFTALGTPIVECRRGGNVRKYT